MTFDKAKSLAIDLLCQDFARLYDSALDTVPPKAAKAIDELREDVQRRDQELSELRTERAALLRENKQMRSVVDAAVQWRKDRYGPKLEQVVDVYVLDAVARR